MKKILFLITCSILMFSCGLSKEELTKEVQKSMEAEWEKNPDNIIKVRSFSLIKKSDSEYSGLLETDESNRETPTIKVEQKYNVEVVTDGKEFKWEIKQ
jgi:hypothetical protein